MISANTSVRTEKPGTQLYFDILQAVIILSAVSIFGCSQASNRATDMMKGYTRDQVIASLGEPDRSQSFVLPAQPFYGPQESLVNLVPAGTVVEEWEYEIEDEILFVWFVGEDDAVPEDWLVKEMMRYPRDAVY